MGQLQEYPLNPVDNILLATHESLRQRGYCGLSVMLIADVEGPLDARDVSAGVQRLGREYPALSARIRLTGVLGRARWQIPADASLEAAIEYQYRCVDEEEGDVDAPLRDAIEDSVDPTSGPQLRLVHVQMAEDRHRLGLRWPHHLMDLEGAHLLLRELHAVLCGEPITLGRDPRATLAPPFRPAFPTSLWRSWQGLLQHYHHCTAHQPRIIGKPEDQRKVSNFQLRRYGAESLRRFGAVTNERTAPGPLRYTRGLMIAIARTYLDICTERGRPREQYLFSQALPVPREGPRPGIHGNHVTIPWVAFTSDDLANWTTADATAARQLANYKKNRRDEADWEMLRAAYRWPFALARWVMTHQAPRGAAGFTSYRFGDTVTRLGNARITNLAAVGPMNCHPGWIVASSTYNENMSIAVTFFEDYIDCPSVTEFLDRLECHLRG